MTILALDPSFSRTGLSIWRSPSDYEVHSITYNSNEENLLKAMDNAFKITKDVRNHLIDLDDEDELIVAVEYPIMATRSGSYLSMITCKLDSLFRAFKLSKVVFLPSVAVKAFTKAQNKTDLVKWVKQSSIVEKFNGNHDEATALVLGEIARLVVSGEYKKSSFVIDYSESPIKIK